MEQRSVWPWNLKKNPKPTKARYTSLRGDVYIYIYTYYDINRIMLLLPIGSLYSAASTSTIFNQKQEESSGENASNVQT